MSETMEGQRKQVVFLTFQFYFQYKALYGLIAISCPWMCQRLSIMSSNKSHLFQTSLISIPYN